MTWFGVIWHTLKSRIMEKSKIRPNVTPGPLTILCLMVRSCIYCWTAPDRFATSIFSGFYSSAAPASGVPVWLAELEDDYERAHVWAWIGFSSGFTYMTCDHESVRWSVCHQGLHSSVVNLVKLFIWITVMGHSSQYFNSRCNLRLILYSYTVYGLESLVDYVSSVSVIPFIIKSMWCALRIC